MKGIRIRTEFYRKHKIEAISDCEKSVVLIDGEPFECSEGDLDRAIDLAKMDIDEGLAW